MDQLETQVSDLRSFLGSAAPVPQGAADVEVEAGVSPHDVASVAYHSPTGPLRAHSHHSSISAPGDNSAPLQHQQQQREQHPQQRQHHHLLLNPQHHQPQSPLEPQLSPAAATSASSSHNAKRSRAEDTDEGPTKQQRSKRNRYISIACNECKRRKIKCNGQTPCQRCGHLNLQCLYAPNCCANFKDSDEFRQVTDEVRELQDQVKHLTIALNQLSQETARLAPLHDRLLPPPPPASVSGATPGSSTSSGTRHHHQQQRTPLPFRVPSSFNGPTSSAFTVDVAKDTLHQMGYARHDDPDADVDAAQRDTPPLLPPPQQQEALPPGLTPLASHHLAQPPPPPPLDPIWEFDEAEMLRLLRVYREEVDVMYPVASMDAVEDSIRHLAAWLDNARRHRVEPSPGLNQLFLGPKTLLLKILMCCALVVDEHGNSPRAERLYESIQPTVDKMLMSEAADVTTLSFLALCAGYRYLSNDEILAWRLIGQVARLCLELGLHRREGLQKIADPQTRRDALHTFWATYILDRRWSFSTGLPFVCHDDKIDPKLPYPKDYPFLVAMIGYSKLGAKIWNMVDHFEPAVIRELKARDFEALDAEIMEWYASVPEEIQTGEPDGDKFPVPSGPYDLQRTRIWTRLRLNQIRIWLYTPVLHSATSTAENAPLARKVVDLAKQTIRLLAHLNSETDMYHRFQVFYHQFLTSSIAVLFLASTHAPLQFSATCRDEFYMALDLVKEMSDRSYVSHRLWRTIRSLRAYAPRLGLEEDVSAASGSSPAAVSRTNAAAPSYLRASVSSGGQEGAGHSPGGSGMVWSPAGLNGVGGGYAGSSSGGSSAPFVAPTLAAIVSPAAQLAHTTTTTTSSRPMDLDDGRDQQSNGMRLQSEMSRIFEGYLGMYGGVGSVGGVGYGNGGGGGGSGGVGMGAPASAAGPRLGSDVLTAKAGDGGVYQVMRDMF